MIKDSFDTESEVASEFSSTYPLPFTYGSYLVQPLKL
jgi:hypothetical protein